MSWPTEEMMTVAVEAAARSAYDEAVRTATERGAVRLDWEKLPPLHKHRFREGVQPYVIAALRALPDPRRSVWIDGLYVGLRNGYEDDNPYPEVSA